MADDVALMMTRTQRLVRLVLLAGIAGATLTPYDAVQGHGRAASQPCMARHAGATAGVIVLTVPVGPQPINAQVDTRTGRVFVANNGGTVSVLDARGGRSCAPCRGAWNRPWPWSMSAPDAPLLSTWPVTAMMR